MDSVLLKSTLTFRKFLVWFSGWCSKCRGYTALN